MTAENVAAPAAADAQVTPDAFDAIIAENTKTEEASAEKPADIEEPQEKLSGEQRQTTAEHIDPTNSPASHRIIGLSIAVGVPPIGHTRINRVTLLQAKQASIG